ncbi:hypothetical protein ACTG9Q_22800 [Actinokineospora sp. 24-640]
MAALVGATATTPATAETAGDSSALSCYGSAKSFSKPADYHDYPPGSGFLATTANCADINLKPTTTRSVKVCFLPYSAPLYCQSGYKTANANQWTVIATNVADNTRFYFLFASAAAAGGQWAA